LPLKKKESMRQTTVSNLYIHGLRSSEDDDTEPTPMLAMPQVDAVLSRGIQQDKRYFRPPDPGRERPRQVSLIDEGTIWRHEAAFGPIDRRFIKSQIVLSGEVFLPDLLGWKLSFEEGAELTLSIYRKPCFAMDLISPGLRESMKEGRQGALARVTRSGVIRVGQRVEILPADTVAEQATDRAGLSLESA
jgi:hypothetical protein